MTEIAMISIPGGTYTLGVPECPPDMMHRWANPRRVETKAFLMAESSVTTGMFKAYLRDAFNEIPPHFSRLADQPDNLPAGGLSWLDAMQYIRWLRAATGTPYRLPTNDEWEAAARGGLERNKFSWGDEEPEGRCDYGIRQASLPLPVKSFPPNGYGLYDMTGSMWTWCSELWVNYTLADPPVNSPTGLSPDLNMIVRGGSFMTGSADYLMCAYVHEDPPDLRHEAIGLRLACDL